MAAKGRRGRGVALALLFVSSLHHCCDIHGFLVKPDMSRRQAPLRRQATRLFEFEGSAPLVIHHAAMKTRNMTVAIQFYSLLGFECEAKFRAGPARAAWLTTQQGSRFELIEVPSHVLQEPEGMKRRAENLMERQELLGWNHLALDVTPAMQERGFSELSDWMRDLNATSVNMFGKSLRVALEPRQQIIGDSVYELAFLYDADGALVEFVHKQLAVEQEMESGWEVWDGKGFV
jgi:catechol 2,3-dioxygenase-like lactoylglutathione lyase family enzyme